MQDNVDKRQDWEERKKRKEQQLERWWSKRVKGNSSLACGAVKQEEQQMSRREGTKKVQDVEAGKRHVQASTERDLERVCGNEMRSKGDEKRIHTYEKAMGRKEGMDTDSDVNWPSTLREEEEEEEDTEVDEEEADERGRTEGAEN